MRRAVCLLGAMVLLCFTAGERLCAQAKASPAARQQQADRQFLHKRGLGPTTPARGAVAERLNAVRTALASHTTKSTVQRPLSFGVAAPLAISTNTTAWQPFGPLQVSTAAYGLVTGRISALAADPNDTSGNTLYVGATGGGVWKSTNAAGNTGSVTFTPLTDDIASFANSMQSTPSLSIGAVTVQPGNPQVILAGTGDPNDALDSYYGVGLLRSGDGGKTWSLISQSRDGATSGTNYSMVGLGFAGFAWSSTTPNLVVAAVSQSLEGLLVNPGFSNSGEMGLYYSTDAGQTWYLSTITDGTNEIVQSSNPPAGSPGNPATSVVWNAVRKQFVAAVRFHGYYTSPDGITWTRMAQQPGANLTAAQCPANPQSTGSQSCPIWRGVLSVQPVTGDTFALTTDINNADQGLYEDVCSATGSQATQCNSTTLAFTTQINDAALDAADGTIPQADYNLALAAVPSQQDTILLAGTEDIYRCSLANSCTWRNTTNDQTCAAAQVSPSTHAIEGMYGASGLLYFGNDGGLWRSTDTVGQTGSVCASSDSAHYQNLNSGLGSLAEVSHLAVSPSSSSGGTLVLVGMGATGVVASESAAAQGGTGAWQQLTTGDGSLVAIDPATPTNWYADAGPGVSIYSCPNGGNCNASGFGTQPVIGRAQVEDDADYFVDAAPWMLDPLNPANMLVGTCRMWLGPVTGGWTSANLLSTMLDGDQGSFCNGNAQLRALGAGGSYNSAQGGEQMYAGMAGPLDGGGTVPGHVYGATVPQSAGVVKWTDLWRNPVTNTSLTTQFNQEGYAISSVAVDPRDTTGRTLYVTVAGFPSGQDGVLYSSTDGGAHWLNITNSLPIAPANKVVVDPNNSSYIYVGGDFGVYYTSNIGACANSQQNCWSQLGANLPNAPVTDLGVYSTGSATILEAATYGRGIWTVGLTTTPVTPQASLSPANYTFPAQAVGTQSPSTGTFTLQNTGSVALDILQIAVSPQSPGGDYSQTNTCGSALAAGASCGISVSFTPSATGARPGTLTVRSNAQSSVLTASLNGAGLTPGAIQLTPGTVTFSATATGSAAANQAITVQNTGGAPVSLGARSLSGTNANDFNLPTGSNCGSSLAAGASCSILVGFYPTQTGARTAQFQLSAGAAGSPFNVNLSGNGVAPASLVLAPTSLAYPSTPVGTTSSAQTINVSNTGGVAAQLGAATTSGDYQIATNTCGSTLAAGASCAVGITFTPTATGSRAGLFTLPSPSIPAAQVTASLSGNGLQPPAFSLSPSSLGFGSQQQGTTSAQQTITITNNGGSPAQSPTAQLNGDFAIGANSCPTTLAVGASCTVGIAFAPTATGLRSGTFTFAAGGSSASASLSGTGTAPPTLAPNPTNLAFPATAEGTSSATQSLSVTNTGANPAQISAVAPSAAFAIASNNCPVAPQSLAANASCSVQVSFSPPATGPYSGTVTFSGNFTTLQVSVTGQGTTPAAATLSPASMAFPTTPQGAVSAAQTFTVTSTGGVAVVLGSPQVTQDFQVSSNNCPANLSPGNSCAIGVLFHPAGTGARSGTFTLPGSMTDSPLTASLSGNAVTPGALSVSPSALQFGQAVIGQTSPAQTATVSNTGGATVNVGTPGISGDYLITSNSCGATLAPGQQCPLGIAFKPTTAGDRPGQLTIPGDGSQSAAVATLDGTGAAAGQLQASPTSLGFGTVAEGSSATATVMVTNSGGTMVHISQIAAGGDYSVSGGTCSANTAVAPSAACTVAVTFTPTSAGPRNATLAVANDGTPAILDIGLAGEGAAPGTLSLAPGSLAFGNVTTGTVSTPQAITASNPGGVPVNLGTPSVTGAGYSIVVNGCGVTLAAGATCTLQLQYAPSAVGSSNGLFSFPGSYSGSPATVALSGSGVTPGALVLSPSPVQFGSVVIQSSATQSITVTNSGGTAVSLGAPTTSAGFSAVSQCGAALAPGTSCTVQVSFTPSTVGPSSGLLTQPGSIAGGAATDGLSGTGVAPGALTANPATLTYPATVVGASSTSLVATFQNPGGVPVALSPPHTSSADFAITGGNCGASLAPSATCFEQIIFTPTAAGARNGTLTLSASSSNGPSAIVTLNGFAEAPASLQFSPGQLSFGNQAVRTTSASQTLALTNTGGVSTPLTLPLLTGQYALTANSCGTTLSAGASCQLAVQFAPLSGGSSPGTLSIASNTGTPSASATLSGTGLVLIPSPQSVSFPVPLPISTTSAPIAIAIENLGTSPIAISSPSITGDFALGNSSCAATLAASSSCAVYVTFTPTAGGLRTGTFSISGGSQTLTVPLTGTGLSPATDTLSPGALSFAATELGQLSPPQAITLANNGDATLAQIATQVAGPFTVVNNCGASLGGHLNCTLAVSFAPTAVGGATGSLTISDAQRTQTIPLTGQGVPPPQAFASPSSVNFGPYAQGIATPAQSVTISNQGAIAMTAMTLTMSGPDFAIASSTCGATLTPGSSCQANVVFTPQVIGNRQGTLTVASPSLSQALVVSLSGSGEDYQIAVVGSGTQVVTNGQTATYQLSVIPVGASTGSLTLACTGAPANAVCTVNPANLSLVGGASGSVSVTVATGVGAVARLDQSRPATSPWSASRWWTGSTLALVCPLFFAASGRRRRLQIVLLGIALLGLPIGCGVHSSGVNGSGGKTLPGQTPSGSTTLTVTALFPGAQRATTVQLVVQ